MTATEQPRIRVGVGGWNFPPWRGTFYPPGLAQSRELAHASGRLTTIEINSTFYGSQKPESFRRWAGETPDDFVFSVKGPRYATNRRELAESGPAIERFFASGVLELGPKLGPVLWQLAPNKAFDEQDIRAFLELLPHEVAGRPISHVLEVRHQSFSAPAFIALMRQFSVPVAFAHASNYPAIPDTTGTFVYARLQRCVDAEPAGYPSAELETWAARFRSWSVGTTPQDLQPVDASTTAAALPRPCFVYFISGAKVRAPAAAVSLLERLAA